MEGQFVIISRLMYEMAGVDLHEGKAEMVKSRVGKRIRRKGWSGFREYVKHLTGPDGREEILAMVDLLTTNKTSFLREPDHFDYLRDRILRDSAALRRGLRIWSAGCSTGEEPYTIAMILRENLSDRDFRKIRILATDINREVVENARAGSYPEKRLDDLPPHWKTRHFRQVQGEEERGGGREFRVSDELRSVVRIARLNLLSDWPMTGPFDCIFCRNVMIYFDTPTRERLVRRFQDLLHPTAGHLFVGQSESLNVLSHDLSYVQPAVYRR